MTDPASLKEWAPAGAVTVLLGIIGRIYAALVINRVPPSAEILALEAFFAAKL